MADQGLQGDGETAQAGKAGCDPELAKLVGEVRKKQAELREDERNVWKDFADDHLIALTMPVMDATWKDWDKHTAQDKRAKVLRKAAYDALRGYLGQRAPKAILSRALHLWEMESAEANNDAGEVAIIVEERTERFAGTLSSFTFDPEARTDAGPVQAVLIKIHGLTPGVEVGDWKKWIALEKKVTPGTRAHGSIRIYKGLAIAPHVTVTGDAASGYTVTSTAGDGVTGDREEDEEASPAAVTVSPAQSSAPKQAADPSDLLDDSEPGTLTEDEAAVLEMFQGNGARHRRRDYILEQQSLTGPNDRERAKLATKSLESKGLIVRDNDKRTYQLAGGEQQITQPNDPPGTFRTKQGWLALQGMGVAA